MPFGFVYIIYLVWECLILKNKRNKTSIQLLRQFTGKETEIEISNLRTVEWKLVPFLLSQIFFSIAFYLNPLSPKCLSLSFSIVNMDHSIL